MHSLVLFCSTKHIHIFVLHADSGTERWLAQLGIEGVEASRTTNGRMLHIEIEAEINCNFVLGDIHALRWKKRLLYIYGMCAWPQRTTYVHTASTVQRTQHSACCVANVQKIRNQTGCYAGCSAVHH